MGVDCQDDGYITVNFVSHYETLHGIDADSVSQYSSVRAPETTNGEGYMTVSSRAPYETAQEMNAATVNQNYAAQAPETNHDGGYTDVN